MLRFKSAVRLASRGLLEVKGVEAAQFLQGLLTKDVFAISASGRPSVSCALLLNVKGRIVSDMLVYSNIDRREEGAEMSYLLETSSSSQADIQRVLHVYKLRKRVDISPLDPDAMAVYYSPQEPTSSGHSCFPDPRVAQFGYRAIGKADEIDAGAAMSEDDYLQRRMEWGLPEGAEELGDELPLNANGDWMNGIDFEKGCYIGQELVARTYYTGVVRRRVAPFRLLTPPVSPKLVPKGTPIIDKNAKVWGKVIRLSGTRGLALFPIEKLLQEEGKKPCGPLLIKLPDQQMMAGRVEVYKPGWWPRDWVR